MKIVEKNADSPIPNGHLINWIQSMDIIGKQGKQSQYVGEVTKLIMRLVNQNL